MLRHAVQINRQQTQEKLGWENILENRAAHCSRSWKDLSHLFTGYLCLHPSMPEMEPVLCYNRGCGKDFIPGDDDDVELKEGEGPCVHHPGAPFFHDAYKGWTCCNRKSTDFTEFLNFAGCTRGRHSRVKPAEPENITGNLRGDAADSTADKSSPVTTTTSVVREPMRSSFLKRPPLETPMRRVKATVAPSLRRELEVNPLGVNVGTDEKEEEGGVKVGEPCKNAGCKGVFSGDDGDSFGLCRYHSGVPIFHEGMKYWSCCQRKTSDFQSFLSQEGCKEGKHCWVKPMDNFDKSVSCRYDWHQTGNKMTVAIYAKKYDPDASFIEVNPIRLVVHMVFPELGENFDLDLELKGIISEEKTTVSMMGTKIEIQLVKAEAGSWSNLNVEQRILDNKSNSGGPIVTDNDDENNCNEKVDALDLDDLELNSGATRYVLSPEASARI